MSILSFTKVLLDDSFHFLTFANTRGISLPENKGMANQIVWSKVHLMIAGITLQCDDQTAAYTKTTPSAITICPASWNSPTKLDSLAAYRSDASSIDDGTPLGQFESTPGTLLHEILHLVSGYGQFSFLFSRAAIIAIHYDEASNQLFFIVFLQQSMISKSPSTERRATPIPQNSALPWRPGTRPWLLPMPNLILGSLRQVT